MPGLEGVVTQALEANRIKEQVLTEQARQVSHAAGILVETLRAGRAVHVLGDEGPTATLATYLAEVFHNADGSRVLPVRLLTTQPGPENYVRAVEGFVVAGDILLLLIQEPSAALGRAMATAMERQARVVGLLGQKAAALVDRCDAAVVVPSHRPFVVAESLLATGHVLQGLVVEGLGRAKGSGSSRGGVQLDTPTDMGVIDHDRDSRKDSGKVDSEEARLLVEAVSAGAAPPTKPAVRRERDVPQNSLRFRCGGCEEVITVEARFAGRKGQCPYCMAKFEIPLTGSPTGSQRWASVLNSPGPGSSSVIRLEGSERRRLEGSSRRKKDRRSKDRRSKDRRQSDRDRRRAPRFTVKDALVRLSKEGYPDSRSYYKPHSLDDMSLTGLRFIGESREFDVGDVFYFAVDFPAFPKPVRFKGEIRRVVPLKNGGGYGAGVRFLEYVGDAEAKIRRLLENTRLRTVRRR